jgi:hypothetical protein
MEAISEEYRAELLRVQQTRALSEEAGEFRAYLVSQGVVEETVKVLLGLLRAESAARPFDGRSFLKAYFDAKALDPFLAMAPPVDVEALLDTNEALRERNVQLADDVVGLTNLYHELQVQRWAPLLAAVLQAAREAAGAAGAEGAEGGAEESNTFDMTPLLALARANAKERALAAGVARPESSKPLYNEPRDALRCSGELLAAWALEEFSEAEGTFEAFVAALPNAEPNADIKTAAVEADATAMRVARLAVRCQELARKGEEAPGAGEEGVLEEGEEEQGQAY